MTALLPVLSPSNILPPSRLITLSFPQGEIAVRASKMSFQNFTYLKLPNFKLRLVTECLTLSVTEICLGTRYGRPQLNDSLKQATLRSATETHDKFVPALIINP